MTRLTIRLLAVLSLLGSLSIATLGTGAQSISTAAFGDTWERTDQPVLDGEVSRTWMWGPEPFTDVLQEPYAESPGGERDVQYYDKSRMEVTDPAADPDSIWYVTNGLLVVELVTGEMQVGDDSFESRGPAEVNVAGDAGDPDGPTYATIASLLDAPPFETGSAVTARVDRAGTVTDDPDLTGQGVTAAHFVPETNHTVASPFWDFMNSTGTVYEDGAYITDNLFQNPFFATGFPITEAYWADVQVGGAEQLVLLQCFERRCLTYTPGNDPGWQVEAGNVGQHYHRWRYGDTPDPDPEPDPTPEPPADCEPGTGENFAGQDMLNPGFTGDDLRCADFSSANIADPDFTDADLYRAIFDDAELSTPLFVRANVMEASFINTDLASADFTDADARSANFSNADLSQPAFTSTNLTEASLANVEMTQPEFDGTVAVNVDFSGATMTQPSFVNADLTGSNLDAATVVGATFVNTTCPDGTNSDDQGGTCLEGIF